MSKRPSSSREFTVNRLRWALLAAVSGVTVSMTACAGRSQNQAGPDGEAGEEQGSGGTAGSTGGSGTGGTQKGSGGSTGATGGAGGSVTTTGGTGGSVTTGGTAGTISAGGSDAGGTGGTVNPGGTGGTAGTPGGPSGCGAATTFVEGQDGNLVYCERRFVHRPEPGSCVVPDRDGPSEGGAAGQAGTGGAAGAGIPDEPPVIYSECETDFDCDERPNGFCQQENIQGISRMCIYACADDSDCAAESEICSCEGPYTRPDGSTFDIGVCRTATCNVDADCASDDRDFLCISPVDASCGIARPGAFHCQAPEDECSGPGDCAFSEQCTHDGTRFVCMGRPACGRPFLVEGTARLAREGSASDWLDDASSAGTDTLSAPIAGADALAADVRAFLSRHYVEAGLMEHASIAAFARFALQLLALGAPAQLVADATEAMRDETRHARVCFGLAARYADGAAIGPGPLAVDGALADFDLLSVAELVITEGCIGETGAAVEAAWAADAALDPTLSTLLRGIADDELRHAALAFRFIAWANTLDARVSELFERRIAEALRTENGFSARRDHAPAAAALLAQHGVLDEGTRAEARRAALENIVLPTAKAFAPRANPLRSEASRAPL